MAVVENAGVDVTNPANRTESLVQNNTDQSKLNHLSSNGNPNFRSNDQNNFHMVANNQQQQHQQKITTGHQTNSNGAAADQMSLIQQHSHSINANGVALHQMNGGVDVRRDGGDEDDGGEGLKQEMRDLEEMLSKLNPMAEEFVPPSLANYRPLLQHSATGAPHFGYITDNNYVMNTNSPVANGNSTRRKKISYSNAKRRMNSRTSMAQREDVIRRTVYVSDIDHQVTEEQLAVLFIGCGQVVDCRVCGDPNSVLRFAFIEFTDEEGARNALSLAGTMLGFYPVRVLPSKTAIAPVNPTFLPRSEDEREMCARTIYCTNIDKKVTQADVKLFFESICGEVLRLRLLGDYHHSTRIAFVEFVMIWSCLLLGNLPWSGVEWREAFRYPSPASFTVLRTAESAIAALNCSGAVLGSLPIRVSPSKTPVRPRAPRPGMH